MAGAKVNRSVRVSRALKEELANIISQEMKDPGLEMVTLTHLKISKDMRSCKVFFTIMGGEEKIDRAGKILNRASGYLKGELGRRFRMKRIPDLVFSYDDSMLKGEKIDQLIRKLNEDER